MRTRTLAFDHQGAWMLGYVEDEDHVFVGFEAPTQPLDPVNGSTIEDFLVMRGRDDLHVEAQEALHSIFTTITA